MINLWALFVAGDHQGSECEHLENLPSLNQPKPLLSVWFLSGHDCFLGRKPALDKQFLGCRGGPCLKKNGRHVSRQASFHLLQVKPVYTSPIVSPPHHVRHSVCSSKPGQRRQWASWPSHIFLSLDGLSHRLALPPALPPTSKNATPAC